MVEKIFFYVMSTKKIYSHKLIIVSYIFQSQIFLGALSSEGSPARAGSPRRGMRRIYAAARVTLLSAMLAPLSGNKSAK